MIRTVTRVVVNNSRKASAARAFPSIATRSFSDKLGIPTDADQQGGRRKIELDAIAAGEVAFNTDPIIPPVEAGTFENPILVNNDAVHAFKFTDICFYNFLFTLYCNVFTGSIRRAHPCCWIRESEHAPIGMV